MKTKLISTKTFRSKERFLQDTIDYFSGNTKERRCFSKSGTTTKCSYNPNFFGVNKPKSEGCAIGRFLTQEQAEQADEFGGVDTIFQDGSQDELLPKWMIKFGCGFLSDVQSLHDKDDYWNEKGLSPYGVDRVIAIIETHELDKTKIKFGSVK